jgi:hypothetical protein
VASDVSNVTKNVPNPYGKSGGPAHQAKIEDITGQMEDKGYIVQPEFKVDTPGGYKPKRFADLLVTDPETNDLWLIQVGKQTQAGNPVSRELKAIVDLENNNWKGKVFFIPYN